MTPEAFGATIAGGGESTPGNPTTGNRVTDDYGTVGSGGGNQAGDNAGTTTDRRFATVGGGGNNTASGFAATVGGGDRNTASESWATVGGGRNNEATAAYATIAGGGRSNPLDFLSANRVFDNYGTVGGGGRNKAGSDDGDPTTATFATVGGGRNNMTTGSYDTVGGGWNNIVSADFGTIGGGGKIEPLFGTPTPGNRVFDEYGTVGGGGSNVAGSNDGEPTTSPFATVGGGRKNIACQIADTVGGGDGNIACGNFATVAGGLLNTASGSWATVPGGGRNTAAGEYSFAAGRNANAEFDGMFVWSGVSGVISDFPSTTEANFTPGADQFLARTTGGVVFVTGVDAGGDSTAGVQLAAGGGSWSSLSDRNAKANVKPVDAREVLDKLAHVPVSTWNYKAQDESIRHIGPMAQDFHAAFAVGEDEKFITTIDADGVALAAIQGLYQIVQEQEARIGALERALAQTSPSDLASMFGVATPAIAVVGLLGLVAIGRRRKGSAR